MLHLQVLGADVLGALVKAKLDQLKVHRVKALLPGFCQSFKRDNTEIMSKTQTALKQRFW